MNESNVNEKFYGDMPYFGSQTTVMALKYAQTLDANANWWMLRDPPFVRDLFTVPGAPGVALDGFMVTWRPARPCSDKLLYMACNTYSMAGVSADTTSLQQPFGRVAWTGQVYVKPDDDKLRPFTLISYQTSSGSVCCDFITDCTDRTVLHAFLLAVRKHVVASVSKDKICITCSNGEDKYVNKERELLCMEPSLYGDITNNCLSFFGAGPMYAGLHLPHRRGLLIAGAPGNGKTLLLRELVRLLHTKHPDMLFVTMDIGRGADSSDLRALFATASYSKMTTILLEDLESLTNETGITRSEFLNTLDGLAPLNGILIISTTNHPEMLDDALLRRPSRFDRVWKIPLPDATQRTKYLQERLPVDFPAEARGLFVEQSGDWSYAYLNDLTVSANLHALGDGRQTPVTEDFMAVFELLKKQFEQCREAAKLAAQDTKNMGFEGKPASRWPRSAGF